MLKPLMQTWRQTWRLTGFCAMATLSLATSAHAKLGAYIRAEPLTVIVPAGQTQGTTTLDWDSGNKDEQAQVWQKVDDSAEKRLSNKPNGNRVVTIKVDEKRTFTLYKNASRNRVLDSVVVTATRARERKPPVSNVPNEWPGGVNYPAPTPESGSAPSYIYAILPDGRLGWFRHDSPTFGTNQWQTARILDRGWNNYKRVFAGEDGDIYTVSLEGTLEVHQHVGYRTGLRRDNAQGWLETQTLSENWGGYKQAFAGSADVIYAITSDDKLHWFKRNGATLEGPKEIGTGWSFKTVFSVGGGIIYAVANDGKLMWYKHTGFANGAKSWLETKVVGSGWGDMKEVFTIGTRTPGVSALDGAIIYAVAPDNSLLWYKHRGFLVGSNQWLPARNVGSGMGGFQHIFGMLSSSTPTARVPGAPISLGRDTLFTRKRAGFISELRVVPGTRSVVISFSSTQKTPPLIEIGKVAPQRNSKGNWEFAPIAAAFARFAPLQDGRRVLDLNVQQEELSLNTTYFYIINVFNDDKSDASLPRAQKTGQFITQNQSVKVVWESVHITNDSDPNGAGEIDLAAFANYGDPSQQSFNDGRRDLPDGRTQNLNWTLNISNAPDTLSLALCGNDSDRIFGAFGGGVYCDSPGDDGDSEWNVAKGKFDLTQYPGASVTVPFDLRSMPNGGDAGDLEFEAKGYIVITRG